MNKILTLVIFITTCLFVKAQDKFQIGLEGSNKITWFNTDEKYINTDGIRYGGGIQIAFDYNFTENYVLSFGLGLSGLGGKTQFVDSLPYFETRDSIYSIPPNAIITNKLECFTLPLTLKLRTNEIGSANIRLYGKIGMRLHIRSKVKGDIDIKSEARFIEGENITKELTFLSLTTPVFAGMEYPLWGKTKLILELGYDHGWTSISNQIKGEDGKMSKRRNVTMSYLSFNTGILF